MLRQRLVADWWAARDLDGAVMIAERRVHVDDLNGRAHALMRAAGALGAEEVTVAGASFSVGDRVVVRRNDPALGVVNGDRGAVVAVDPARGRIDLALPGGQVVAAARLSRAPDSAWPSGARARLRDHRASRPGHDLPPDVHPRDRLAHARGRLRRAEPRQGEQPDLRDRAGRHGARRVRARDARATRRARRARPGAPTLQRADARHRTRPPTADRRRATGAR